MPRAFLVKQKTEKFKKVPSNLVVSSPGNGFVANFRHVSAKEDRFPVAFHSVTDFGWERRPLTYPAEITFAVPQPLNPSTPQERNPHGTQDANSHHEIALGQNSRTKHLCDQCSKSYTTVTTLLRHQQLHCNPQQKKPFHCKYCDKLYVSLGALKMHIRTHTLPCKCKICGKAFSRPWLLQGHIRTHTGEKPYKCPSCQRAFADRSNLRAHLQTHSEVKKYCCARCSKSFSRMSLLLKHEETGCLTDELAQMFTAAGLVEEQNHIDRRLQVNRGRQLRMYRVWIQCKYRKPR